MRPITALGLSVLAAVLFSCGSSTSSGGGGSSSSSSTSATSSASTAVCQARQQIKGAVDDLSSLSLSVGVIGRLQTDIANIQTGLAQLKSARGAVAQARVDDLTNAVDSLKSSVDSVGTGTPISQVLSTLPAEVAAVKSAFQPLFDSVTC